jgi:nitrogen fixation protein NifZ
MGLQREQTVEITGDPIFRPGERVRSLKFVRNDGTVRGFDIGDELVRKGDIGYVRDIGTFLQQFYIYAIEWVERGTIVGMRGKELESLDRPGVTGKRSAQSAAEADALERACAV